MDDNIFSTSRSLQEKSLYKNSGRYCYHQHFKIDCDCYSSFKIKGHYFANFRIASVNSSSSSGIAILVYPKIDQFEKSNAFTTELRTLKIP